MSRGCPCLQQGDAAAWTSRPPAAGAELGHAEGVLSRGSTSPLLNTPGPRGKAARGARRAARRLDVPALGQAPEQKWRLRVGSRVGARVPFITLASKGKARSFFSRLS